MERKLAAILAADVVGYSRLMGEDEAGTLASLKSHRAELINPKAAQYNGRTIKLMGDGTLMEFASVVDATTFAVEVQTAMELRNTDLPEDRQIRFRVGINIGDVIVEGDDIYGDGVNVASRLEELAEPGGICIRRNVRNQIRDKLDLTLEDLGEVEVKNISRPVRAFRLVLDDKAKTLVTPIMVTRASNTYRRWPIMVGLIASIALIATLIWRQVEVPDFEPANAANLAFPLPNKPSIAVLAFDNLSGDASQEFLSDGFSEDITSALVRIPQLFVIARNSAFTYKGKPVKVQQVAEELGVRYILEGSIQQSGDRLRVTAQLVDAFSGHHIWSEKYDREMADLFTVKDDITLKVVSNMNVELVRGDTVWSTASSGDNLDAWLLGMQAWALTENQTREAFAESIKLNERALKLAPDSVRVRDGLGWNYYLFSRFGWAESPKETLERAAELASQAIELDPTYAGSYGLMSNILLQRREYTQAIKAGERSVALAPSDSDMLAVLALVYQKAMMAKNAITTFKSAMRLNPYYPNWVLENLGEAYVMAGQYEDAIRVYLEGIDRGLSGWIAAECHIGLAISYDGLGRAEEARAEIVTATEVFPQFTVSFLRKWQQYKDPDYTEQWLATLKRLGLPEE